jgi:hypothetical protein
MGTGDMSDGQPFEKKSNQRCRLRVGKASRGEPEKINVKRTGETVTVNGEIDVDAGHGRRGLNGGWPLTR